MEYTDGHADWTTRLLNLLQHEVLSFSSGFRHSLRVGKACPMHAHAAMELVYHPTGSGFVSLNTGEDVPFEEGDVVVCRPDTPHDQMMRRPGEDCCVLVAGRFGYPSSTPRCWRVNGLDAAMRSDLQLLSNPPGAPSEIERRTLDLRATALVIAILARSRAQRSAADVTPAQHYADLAHELVSQDYARLQGVAELAGRIGISPDYLRHVFSERHGMSIGRFLCQVRLERAKELLSHSRVPLKTIATMCGFSNERYLCHVFQKHHGCTPGKYRRKGQRKPLTSGLPNTSQ